MGLGGGADPVPVGPAGEDAGDGGPMYPSGSGDILKRNGRTHCETQITLMIIGVKAMPNWMGRLPKAYEIEGLSLETSLVISDHLGLGVLFLTTDDVDAFGFPAPPLCIIDHRRVVHVDHLE